MRPLPHDPVVVDFEIPRSAIDRDLAPLSREECAHRGILHSSEDDHEPLGYATLTAVDLARAAKEASET